jgi:FAD-dependent urate hydroxylase
MTRAAIIGAGIGGTAAGIALTRLGYEVEIYDQIVENRPVGAAISVWSNGVKALNWLGLETETAALGGRMDTMAYRDGRTGTTMCEFSLAPVTDAMGQRPYPIARAELQQMLIDAYQDRSGRPVRFGRRMTALAQDGDVVEVSFADGSQVTADLVIAADGARSVTRAYVLGRQTQPRYAGYVNINGLLPVDPRIGPPQQWTTYVADGMRASVMPVAGDRFYFFLDVLAPPGLGHDPNGIRSELVRHFDGWAPQVQRLISALDPATTNRVEIHDTDPFDTWVRGRVALLGDSAHHTTPDIGQGGCLALEDVVVLERILATTTLGIEDALRRYEAARAPRAADLVLRARRRCDVTHGADPAVTQAWYDELRHEDGAGVMAGIIGNMRDNPLD